MFWRRTRVPRSTPTSRSSPLPDSQERLTRKGFIGLGAVEDYSANIVYRHEQTLSGPKKDRLEVLRHTHAHFGQLFMLYPDPGTARSTAFSTKPPRTGARRRPSRTNTTLSTACGASDGEAQIAAIQRLMSDKKLLIADGHHRYETALNFRNEHPELADARNVMMTFVNMYSPGLKILATHRVLSNLAGFDVNAFIERVSAEFTVHRLPDVSSLHAMLDDTSLVRIGVAATGTSEYFVLERERRPQDLDVRILHDTLLRDALGIGEEAVRDEKHIRYVRGVEAAVDAVRNGGAQIAFLLQPTSVEQTADISFAGGVMPQKSTDFYPKLLSGVTIYKLEK